MQNLKENDKYPTTLNEFISEGGIIDKDFEYESIEPVFVQRSGNSRYKKPNYRPSMKLPKRIDSPLVPWPQEVKDYMTDIEAALTFPLQENLYDPYCSLKEDYTKLRELNLFSSSNVKTDIDSLKKMIMCTWNENNSMNSYCATHAANRMMQFDLSILTNEKVTERQNSSFSADVPSFVDYALRFGALTNYELSKKSIETVQDVLSRGGEELFITTKGCHVYVSHHKGKWTFMLQNSSVFYLANEEVNYAWIGPTEYLDFAVTFAETLMNLSIIMMITEYKWAQELIKELDNMIRKCEKHNDYVALMKTYESVCLLMSDCKGSTLLNWTPIVDGLDSMRKSSIAIDRSNVSLDLVMQTFLGLYSDVRSRSVVIRLLSIMFKMNSKELQEASALHKLCWYSEVDYMKGLRKYLKRVHTPRPFDPTAVKELVWMAKREFFLSYTSKHSMIPHILKPEEKSEELTNAYKFGQLKKIELKDLSWWDDVQIWKCLDNTQTDDPLEYAKDKGALKPSISFGPGDSLREIIQLLQDSPYKVGTMDFSRIKEDVRFSVYGTSKLDGAVTFPFPTKLCIKEREQKDEGRFFGVGTNRMKHNLSYMMAKAKKVLSYFHGQLMTPSDKERKEMLHEASQQLNDDDCFSLLLDIEGHNQSMQPGNTAELLEFIGNLYGEVGWGSMSHYFANLVVYYFDQYIDKCCVSRGQKGGIEGWMNPVWTLHTLLGIKRVILKESMIVRSILTYSDDVNFVLKLLHVDSHTVSTTFNRVRDRLIEIGMICKLSQTAITKTRTTILRQHYYKGELSSSTLKKLVSASIFCVDTFSNEESRVDGMSSAATSAIEMSNQPKAVVFFKWFKMIYVSLRLYAQIFDYSNEKSLLSKEDLPTSWSKILQFPNHLVNTIGSRLSLIGDKYNVAQLRAEITAELGQGHAISIASIIRSLYGDGIDAFHRLRTKDMVTYLLTKDESFCYLYYMILNLPGKFGGFGSQLMINQCLTGHSDATLRQVYYLEQGITHISENKLYLRTILVNSMIIKHDIDSQEERTLSSTSKWVGTTSHQSVNSYISDAVSRYMRKLCLNPVIKQLFQIDENRKDFVSEVGMALKGCLNFRVFQFYTENSVFYLLDLLLSKVDNSTGLSSKVTGKKWLRTKIRKTLIERRLDIFRVSRRDLLETYSNMEVLEILTAERKRMYKQYQFDEIDEPLYDHMLIRTRMRESDILVSPGLTSFQDGKHLRYLMPPISGSVLFKGEYIGPAGKFGSIQSFLALKLTAVTKWMLMLSDLNPRAFQDILLHPYYECCQYALATLTDEKYESLVNCSPDAVSGEIRHRVPNSRFVQSASIKVLPREIHSMIVYLNQSSIYVQSLEDTNINFDYLRYRLQLKHVMQDYCDLPAEIMYHYKIKTDDSIRQVRIDQPDWRITRAMKRLKPVVYSKQKRLTAHYMNALGQSFALSEEADLPIPSDLDVNDESLRSIVERIRHEAVVTYYRSQVRSGIIYQLDEYNMYMWKSFIKRYKSIDPSVIEMNDHELSIYLSQIIIKWAKEQSSLMESRGTNIDRSVLIELFEDRCPDIANGLRSIEEEIGSIREMFIRLKSRQKDLSRSSEAKAVVNSYQTTMQKYTKAAVFWIMVNYALKFSISNGTLDIDFVATLEHMVLILSRPIEADDESLDILSLKLVLGAETMMRVMNEMNSEFFDIVRDTISQALSIDTYDGGVLKSIKPEKMDLSEEVLQLVPSGLLSREEKISMGVMMSKTSVAKTLNTTKQIVELYSDPVVYNSSTGSDSLVAQYYLFDHLFRTKRCNTSTRICDMTAGRGDGCIALSQFTKNYDSYAVIDIFTKAFVHSKVITAIPYDLTQPETCRFIEQYDWIHIDVSYVGKGHNKLNSFMCYLFGIRKPFSIRLNSLDVELEEDFCNRYLMMYDFSIYYPLTLGKLWYQVYLICTPKSTYRTISPKRFDEEPAVIEMISVYAQQIRMKYLLADPNEKIVNSTTMAIGRSLTADTIFDVFDTQIHLKDSHELHTMGLDFLTNMKGIWIPDTVIETMERDTREKFEGNMLVESDNESLTIDTESLLNENLFNEEVALTTRSGKKEWREKVKEIVRDIRERSRTTSKYRWLNLRDAHRNWMMRHYPVSRIRKMMILTTRLSDRIGIKDEQSIIELVRKYNDEYRDTVIFSSGLRRKMEEINRYMYHYLSGSSYQDTIGLIIVECNAADESSHKMSRMINTFKRSMKYLDNLRQGIDVGFYKIDPNDMRKRFAETSKVSNILRTSAKKNKSNYRLLITDDDEEIRKRFEDVISSIRFDDIGLSIAPIFTGDELMTGLDTFGNKHRDGDLIPISVMEDNLKSTMEAFSFDDFLTKIADAANDEEFMSNFALEGDWGDEDYE